MFACEDKDKDCAGVEGGSAIVDRCGVCEGSGFLFDSNFEQRWELLYGESYGEEWSEWNNPDTYSIANNSYILDISCDSFSIVWEYEEENPPWKFSGSWNPIEAPSQYSYLDLMFI